MTEATGSQQQQQQQLANPQVDSPFFSRLPLEVRRRIYECVWEAAGPTQHIFTARSSQLLGHCRCVTDPDAEDTREADLGRLLPPPPPPPEAQDPGAPDRGDGDELSATSLQELRVVSDWSNHHACEEHPLPRPPSPFLALLLAGRRAHGEARDSLYESLTFSFVGAAAMARFLGAAAPASLARVRAAHLAWRAPPETYTPPGDAEFPAADMDRWARLWRRAARRLPALRELRLWLYPVYPRGPMPHEAWFRPLRGLGGGGGGLRSFTVCLSWFFDAEFPGTGALGFLEGAPFEHRRVAPQPENPEEWRRQGSRAAMNRRRRLGRRFYGERRLVSIYTGIEDERPL